MTTIDQTERLANALTAINYEMSYYYKINSDGVYECAAHPIPDGSDNFPIFSHQSIFEGYIPNGSIYGYGESYEAAHADLAGKLELLAP